jgi:Zn-dependent peptidase ImmA (M78 family)
LAHEIGHAILHPTVNTPFLKANTLFLISRIEREANEFAVELLMPDYALYSHENQCRSLYEIAASCGVPDKLVELKRLNT